MDKKKLLVSFSGGETSAYMCWLLKEKYQHYYDMIFVFANVGEENEETLIFADKVDKMLNLNLVWVEPLVTKIRATKHTVVKFDNAERSGISGNFEKMVAKYGIPNAQNSICTREMKERPITSYARSIGWKRLTYYTAIGIRADEFDRISKNYLKNKFVYPLVTNQIGKEEVNRFWRDQKFRLQIKGYQGNCKWCWKKSYRKLYTIMNEDVQKFEFPRIMEAKYGDYTANLTRSRLLLPMTFFRGGKSVKDIRKTAKLKQFIPATDDKIKYNENLKLDFEEDCGKGCEVFL